MRQIVLTLLILCSLSSYSQVNTTIDENKVNTSFLGGICDVATWNRPFWADMHSTITRGEYAFAFNSSEYDWGNNGGIYRPYVFSNLGADLPLWAGNFGKGKFGLDITIPFFIDVWMDFFERITAPIINASYRFGMPEAGLIYRFDNKKFLGIRNVGIKLSPMKHECTHIGDELTIKRIMDSLPITRVNVSYNYYQAEITINDADGSTKSNLSAKIGAMLLHHKNLGWYNMLAQEGDTSLLVPSKSPWELWLQLQYQSNTSKKTHLQFIASVEWRSRVNYSYPFYFLNIPSAEPNNPEQGYFKFDEMRFLNFNGFIGVRYNNPKVLKYHKIGIGLRAYNGINPYGQFRNIPFYNQIGLCLLFE